MNKSLLLSILAVALVGCEGLNIGAPSETDTDDPHFPRRNISHIFKDDDLSHQVYRAIRKQYSTYANQVKVVVYDDDMLLLGQVPNARVRQSIESTASRIADHRHVINRISIEPAASSLVRTSDSWISTKIKAQLLGDHQIHGSQFKVVTENGVVYLMGRVSPEETALATQIAKQTTGVKKVVTVVDRS
jgi:osmotically-inducible protein OsmY